MSLTGDPIDVVTRVDAWGDGIVPTDELLDRAHEPAERIIRHAPARLLSRQETQSAERR